MANRLLDLDGTEVVEVNYDTDPSAKWTIGFDLQAAAVATTMTAADPCSNQARLIAGQPNSSPPVYTVSAFAAAVSARRNVRCALGVELDIVQTLLLEGGTTSAAEAMLWYGNPAWDSAINPSLQNTDVQTVAAAAGTPDTLAAVIGAYSALTAEQSYLVHLGIKSALDLSALGYAYNADEEGQLRIRATGMPVVVSPYYPQAGVALTGPVQINVGPPDAYQVYDSDLNRTNINGNQLVTVAFDPSTAVRAV